VEEPKAGKSYALNKALTLITGGWICFIDDDQRVDENYYKSVIDAISNYPDNTLFCGKLTPDWAGHELPGFMKKELIRLPRSYPDLT